MDEKKKLEDEEKKLKNEEERLELVGLNSYYQTTMNMLSRYLQIVWNRFNWFSTLNIALFSFYFTKTEVLVHNTIPIIAIFLTAVWFFIAIMDYATINRLKEKNKNINNEIMKFLKIETMGNKSYLLTKLKQNMLLYLIPLIILSVWLFLLFR